MSSVRRKLQKLKEMGAPPELCLMLVERDRKRDRTRRRLRRARRAARAEEDGDESNLETRSRR